MYKKKGKRTSVFLLFFFFFFLDLFSNRQIEENGHIYLFFFVLRQPFSERDLWRIRHNGSPIGIRRVFSPLPPGIYCTCLDVLISSALLYGTNKRRIGRNRYTSTQLILCLTVEDKRNWISLRCFSFLLFFAFVSFYPHASMPINIPLPLSFIRINTTGIWEPIGQPSVAIPVRYNYISICSFVVETFFERGGIDGSETRSLRRLVFAASPTLTGTTCVPGTASSDRFLTLSFVVLFLSEHRADQPSTGYWQIFAQSTAGGITRLFSSNNAYLLRLPTRGRWTTAPCSFVHFWTCPGILDRKNIRPMLETDEITPRFCFFVVRTIGRESSGACPTRFSRLRTPPFRPRVHCVSSSFVPLQFFPDGTLLCVLKASSQPDDALDGQNDGR